MLGLSRWPTHLSASQHVQMKMKHTLSAILAIIDHHTIAIWETFLSGNLPCYTEQMTQELQMQDTYTYKCYSNNAAMFLLWHVPPGSPSPSLSPTPSSV